ncbi:MAG: hypothetical protein HRT82_05970 [Henriciella sp.]|nr:hypothetical protein [Henriciella sp.]
MSRLRFSSALAALAILGACATATPYQAALDGQKGYANQQIETNRWQISFAGNSLTDRQTVETYLLYRAAELTDQEGFDYFRVIQRETDADRRIVTTGFGGYDPFYSNFYCDYRFYSRTGRLYGYPHSWHRRRAGIRGFYGPFGYHDPFWGSSFDYREIVRYEATSEIMMGKGEKPDDPSYFNADEVLMNLSGRIVRPEV